jgi:hypothetical protein
MLAGFSVSVIGVMLKDNSCSAAEFLESAGFGAPDQ